MDYQQLPHVNAFLNALAAVLLVVGVGLIKRGHETAHKRVMLGCFGVSVIFLISYLIYHAQAGSKRFPDYPPPAIRMLYLSILLTHTILAASVPFLALLTIYHGLRDHRRQHRKIARWTFPIWLYVSVTGVIVYLMLYQIYPPRHDTVKINGGIVAPLFEKQIGQVEP